MRTRKHKKEYDRYQETIDDSCVFCELRSGQKRVLSETKSHWVTKNLFGYDTWDGHAVIEHLMLVPKRHVTSLADLKQAELTEFAMEIARLESSGYSVYSRAPNNGSRSIAHVHTHLIKLGGKPKKFMFFTRKPYIMISR